MKIKESLKITTKARIQSIHLEADSHLAVQYIPCYIYYTL
jgi:hypothetical protein